MTSANDTAMSAGRGPAERKIEAPEALVRLLELADVRFDGGRPWDIQVRDPELYDRVLRHGSLGFGEAYMDGAWESERLDETFDRLVEQAWRTTDQEERLRLYRQAEEILIEAASIVPISYRRFHFLLKPWAGRPPMSSLGTWLWKEMNIEPH